MLDELSELIQLAAPEYAKMNVGGLCLENYVILVNDNFDKYKILCDNYGITKSEFFVYALLTGGYYSEIQHPLAVGKKPNKFISKCVELYDDLLFKIPVTQHKILYRKEKYMSLKEFVNAKRQGKPVKYRHYLTASTDDFKGELQLVITPLPNGKSRAHDVYLIYNHGESSGITPEYQINFERNTSFIVDKIEYLNGTDYIHCHEI